MGLIIRSLYFHSRENLMRGWIYRNIIFSFPTIFRGGDKIVTLYFHPWQYLVRGEYIVTLYFHSWQYLVRGWLYRDIIFHPWQCLMRGWLYRDIFSLLKIFGEGVIISWHYNIISDTTLESGTGGDYIWIFSHSKFDSAVIPGFYYSYPYIHPMKLGGLSDYI